MADIGLRTYLHQVDGLIEQKQLDEAIIHCKHILTHYPKNLETYRLLGKALLEKGRHGDAADIFQRVLSAVPEDFVAHVGMSIVREDEANQEAALWHMERAFESNPGNTAIQEELRRLYGKRDGVVPPRARLTRGALARLYVKGELYPQAEAELRAALAEDADRLDLMTLLARVLAASGRRAEAGEVCNTLLQKLPYSQEGNRILAEIFMAQNRLEDARPYRQRLEALDPYEAFADGHGAHTVRDEAVRLPELTQTPEELAAPPETPDWAMTLGETLETPLAAPAADAAFEEEPDWLKTGTGRLHAEPAAFTEAADLPAPGDVPDWLKDVEPVATTPAPELPDWMKVTTGMLADTPEEPGQPKKKTGSLSEWLKPEDQPVDEQPLAGAELPDWMKDVIPAETPPSAGPAFGLPEDTSTSRLDEMPEWMKAADQETAALPNWMTGKLSPEASETSRLEDLPAWMRDAEAAPPAGAPAGTEEELPAWMRREAEPAATGPLEDLEPEALPEWLKAARASTTGPAEAEPGEARPPWMPSPVENAPAASDEALASEELPEWLKAAAPAEIAFAEPESPAAAPGEAEPDAALPEWMRTLSAETSGAAEEDEARPEWMQPPAAETPASAPAAAPVVDLPDFLQPASPEAIERANQPVDWEVEAPAPEAAPVEATGVPDWIKAMAPDMSAPSLPIAEEELPPVASDELPDWLRPTASAAAVAGIAAGLAASQPEPAPGEGEPASAEIPDWLAAAGQEPAAPASPSDMPDWLKAVEAETAQPTPSSDMPDWLKAISAEAEAPGFAPPTPTPAAAEAAPDLSTMDADEALRWLETLAARQGAAPEELITKPEERLEQAPGWVGAQPEPPSAGAPPDAQALPDWARAEEAAGEETFETVLDDASVPDWLRKPGEPAAAPPADWLRAPLEPEPLEPPAGEPALPDWLAAGAGVPAEAAPVAPTPAEAGAAPDLSTMDADEAMRWLETLAARQGAAAEELITPPEERLEAPPGWVAAEAAGPVMPPTGLLPDTFQPPETPAEPGPEAVAPEEPLPDWLKALQAEPAIPEAPAPPEPEAQAGAVPDLSTMDADEAMRWLETLAARQGAAAEELITPPEERLEAPPAWIAETPAAPVSDEAPTPEAPATPAIPDEMKTSVPAWIAGWGEAEAVQETPDWLKAITPSSEPTAAPAEAAPETGRTTPETPEAEPASSLPDWIKALAGPEEAAGLPAETAPVTTRAEAPPDWVTAGVAPEAEPPTAPATQPPPAEAAPAIPSAQAEPQGAEGGREKLSRLAEKLAAGRRAKDLEVAERLEKQRAEREAAQREVAQKMEERRSRQPGTGPLRPGTGPLKPKTGPLPSPEPAAAEPAAPPPARPAPRPAPPAIRVPSRLTRSRKGRGKSPYAGQPPADLLGQARERAAAGDAAGAADIFGYLIHHGHALPEVIAALESATLSQPNAAPLFQALGDAYMKGNHLQRALDAYRQALAQL